MLIDPFRHVHDVKAAVLSVLGDNFKVPMFKKPNSENTVVYLSIILTSSIRGISVSRSLGLAYVTLCQWHMRPLRIA